MKKCYQSYNTIHNNSNFYFKAHLENFYKIWILNVFFANNFIDQGHTVEIFGDG